MRGPAGPLDSGQRMRVGLSAYMPNSVERDAKNLLADYVDENVSQKNAARKLGISPQYLGDMLMFKRAIPDRVLKKLGYRYDTQLVKVSD